ncbi:NUDIX hydrolase [Pseudotabrizicola alkalilacus]|uniref:NUDIX domain-containing protein n=1 Tax=Pseudotabrizicola alkalilacus TaxID=2305252 RepID=A0A411YZ61_9RHOB|nr:NUDIX hydrolase [Pseudotabrizicola alkalilacus]RGP36100.1 NUDIX domain-containing protein [Pseudotabrizicola alkalilacus]
MQPPLPLTPPRPIPAVLAVVLRAGQVLLVQRANPPDAGLWGFPGGKVDFGESLLAAAERELWEETGVRAVADRAFAAVDAYDHGADGRLRQHFVLVAVLCHWQAGEPEAADDALDARWVALNAMEQTVVLSRDVAEVARQAAGLV